MATFGSTTPDFVANWDTFGPTGGQNQNQLDTVNTLTVPAGGITISLLERGMDSAASQAGATVSIGIYDITSGTTNAPRLATYTINSRTDNAGYVWHSVATSITVAAGKVIAIGTGLPTANIWSTRSATDLIETISPGTNAIPANWTATASGQRVVPLRATYTVNSSTSLNSINGGTVLSGSTGNVANTTGLGALASLTIGGKAATNLAVLTANSTSFDFPMPTAGQLYPDWATQTAVATDSVPASGSLAITLGLPANYQSVTIASVVSAPYYIAAYVPTLAVGDKVLSKTPASLGVTANGVSTSGEILSDYHGVQTMYVRQATTGYIWELTVTLPILTVTVKKSFALGLGLGIGI